MEKVDCSGLLCPAPLIKVRQALKTTSELSVIIDNQTSFDNVSKFLAESGYKFVSGCEKGVFTINISSQPMAAMIMSETKVAKATPKSTGRNIVVVSSNIMGHGSDELGAILIKGFITSIAELEPLPAEVIFYNSGVLLATKSSATADTLVEMHRQGVKITVCGTCVDYFGVKGELAVGEISNMYSIVLSMNGANNIIKP